MGNWGQVWGNRPVRRGAFRVRCYVQSTELLLANNALFPHTRIAVNYAPCPCCNVSPSPCIRNEKLGRRVSSRYRDPINWIRVIWLHKTCEYPQIQASFRERERNGIRRIGCRISKRSPRCSLSFERTFTYPRRFALHVLHAWKSTALKKEKWLY